VVTRSPRCTGSRTYSFTSTATAQVGPHGLDDGPADVGRIAVEFEHMAGLQAVVAAERHFHRAIGHRHHDAVDRGHLILGEAVHRQTALLEKDAGIGQLLFELRPSARSRSTAAASSSCSSAESVTARLTCSSTFSCWPRISVAQAFHHLRGLGDVCLRLREGVEGRLPISPSSFAFSCLRPSSSVLFSARAYSSLARAWSRFASASVICPGASRSRWSDHPAPWSWLFELCLQSKRLAGLNLGGSPLDFLARNSRAMNRWRSRSS